MKPLYTAALVFTAMTMAAPQALNAQQPASLIRTDRVWEYLLRSEPGYIGNYTYVWTSYRFEGSEERYGKVYTPLYLVSKTDMEYDHGKKEVISLEKEECKEKVALLREEDGKVFLLIESGKEVCYDPAEIPAPLPMEVGETGIYEKEVPEGTEALLYDFQSPSGEEELCMMRYSPCRGPIEEFINLITPVKLMDVEEVDAGELGLLKKRTVISGMYLAALEGRALQNEDGEYDFNEMPSSERDPAGYRAEYMEGIGNIGMGDLISVGTVGYINGVTGPGLYEERLNNVYDLDGNIIYRGLDYKIPSAEPSALIRTDRVWEYYSMDNSHALLERYSFQGTEEVGGETYHKLVLTNRTGWTEGEADVAEEELSETKALLRQEGEKVYLLLKGEKIREFDSDTRTLSAAYIPEGPQEVLLYDFGAREGDSYRTVVSIQWGTGLTPTENVLTRCVVSSAEEVESDGAIRSKLTIVPDVLVSAVKSPDDCAGMLTGDEEGEITMRETSGDDTGSSYPSQTEIRYVGGIGTVNSGYMTSLLAPEAVFLTSYIGYQVPILNNVYDEAGAVVFRGVDHKAPETNSIGETVSATKDDAPIFDLMGRQITEPLPGTVYIRAGKKYVGR